MSDSVRPHRRQFTRLPRRWDSPGKNTGMSCHFLLQCMKVKSESESLSCVRLFTTVWTAAYQAPPSIGFCRQECWSRVPLPSPIFCTVFFISRLLQLYFGFSRLLPPRDSPGKSTGVGCHFLLQCMKVKSESESLSHVRLFSTPWTAAHQSPVSMGFSRQEYWSGVPLPSPSML